MRPEFATVIDPIFLVGNNFQDRIDRGLKLVVADERTKIIAMLDSTEAILGNTQEWQLSKYAICAWLDAKLSEANWPGRQWWRDNSLEKLYFGSGSAKEEFFVRASDAATLSRKDALEVFYLTVIFGFRGVYAHPDINVVAERTRELKIPSSIDGWCRDAVKSMCLKQGRPTIAEHLQPQSKFEKLTGRTTLSGYLSLTALLLAATISCAILLFGN